MKKKSTYRLLLQSEEKNRNILEAALYALFALSALTAIWQFVEEPAMPHFGTGMFIEQPAKAGIPS
jgi:hypothetical protein